MLQRAQDLLVGLLLDAVAGILVLSQESAQRLVEHLRLRAENVVQNVLQHFLVLDLF